MNDFTPYAPVIIAVVAFLFQMRLFVTPAQLECKHREILCDAETKFASKQSYSELKEDFKDVKEKLDKIYEWMSSH